MELSVEVQKKIGSFSLDGRFSLNDPRSGIFGASGSGKSTLFHLLAGLVEPDSGTITFNGEVFYDSNRNICLSPEKRRIGVVFQHAHLFPHMSVKKNLLYGWKRCEARHRKIDPEELFEVLGIDSLLQRRITNLSGGERQRVALARTILASPKLILMDEPLSGLDQTIKLQIVPYLNRVFDQFNIPLIFISHSVLEMRLMTNDTLIMENGRIKNHFATEMLAGNSWEDLRQGYVNLLRLGPSVPRAGLFSYTWGNNTLITTEEGVERENLFELDAREILLFKCHPQATSARNLLTCIVKDIYVSGNRARVELDCNGNCLTAQIVPESVSELELQRGSKVIAAIKASAFRKLL